MRPDDPRPIGFFELLFMSVWLGIWTLGVSVIQNLSITGSLPIVGIFLFTHGGAEVFVLSSLSRRLRTSAESSTDPPKLELDHAGLRARWVEGNGRVSVFIVAALIGLVVHGMLIGSASMAVSSTTSPGGVVIGLAAIGVWIFTGVRWGRGVFAHLRTRRVVELDADLDRVRITRGEEVVELPLVGFRVQSDGSALVFGTGERAWLGECAPGDSRDEMLEMLELMASRAVHPDTVEVPEPLRRLRQGEFGSPAE